MTDSYCEFYNSHDRVHCNVYSILWRFVGVLWRTSVCLNLILCKFIIHYISFFNFEKRRKKKLKPKLYTDCNFCNFSMQTPCIIWLILKKPNRWSFHWIASWVSLIPFKTSKLIMGISLFVTNLTYLCLISDFDHHRSFDSSPCTHRRNTANYHLCQNLQVFFINH